MAAKTFIIEHMEPDDAPSAKSSLPPWVTLEYKHIGSFVHKAIFSSLSSSSAAVLNSTLPETCQATTAGIESLLETMDRQRVCLLDPKATQALAPADAEQFDAVLFGGILGDDPPRDRTGELRKLGLPSRHLGEVQMTTDTACLVTKLVLEDGRALEGIPYIDKPTIHFDKKSPGDIAESVDMPFRYVALPPALKEPVLPEGMKQHLYEDMDRSFDI